MTNIKEQVEEVIKSVDYLYTQIDKDSSTYEDLHEIISTALLTAEKRGYEEGHDACSIVEQEQILTAKKEGFLSQRIMIECNECREKLRELKQGKDVPNVMN